MDIKETAQQVKSLMNTVQEIKDGVGGKIERYTKLVKGADEALEGQSEKFKEKQKEKWLREIASCNEDLTNMVKDKTNIGADWTKNIGKIVAQQLIDTALAKLGFK